MAGAGLADEIKVHLDDDFLESVVALDPVHGQRVLKAINMLKENPEHPNLKLKRLKRELDDLWSMRAGREVRVLLHRRGATFIALTAGMRRDVYEKADRGRFIVNPGRRFIGFVDTEVPAEARRQPLPTGAARTVSADGGVFKLWAHSELSEAGFTNDEIAVLRSLDDEYELLSLGWPNEREDLAVALVELTPEAWRAGLEGTSDPEERIGAAIAEFGGLTGISPQLSDEVLRRLAEAPIEDWMVFLHPDQQTLVDAEFRGPARVRGAAGTGKTVVALHRAASLARRVPLAAHAGPRPVLFTTVVSNLIDVFAGLYRRLPGRVDGRVDFLSLEDAALAVFDRSGVERPKIDRAAVDEAYQIAWASVPVGDPLRSAGLTSGYVRTEIEKVVKGRGLRSETDYLSVVRTGRQCGLARSSRTSVWELARRWDEEMRARGTISAPDLVNEAVALLSQETRPWYGAVIVDEAQDLTLAGLQLLRRLSNGTGPDRPDGLFLVGDGAQRIQPGGFTLRQAGVEVRGRTTVLRVNYRNTAEIIAAALVALGEEKVADLDEEFRRGEQIPEAIRSGQRPRLSVASDDAAEAAAVVSWINDVTSSEQVGVGDVAVLLPEASRLDPWIEALASCSVRTVRLERYEGETSDRVKIGTHAQSKGLEFKVVILPELGRDQFPAPQELEESPDERTERTSLMLSHLFVAMTRARDLLVATCVHAPSRWVEAFDLVRD